MCGKLEPDMQTNKVPPADDVNVYDSFAFIWIKEICQIIFITVCQHFKVNIISKYLILPLTVDERCASGINFGLCAKGAPRNQQHTRFNIQFQWL